MLLIEIVAGFMLCLGSFLVIRLVRAADATPCPEERETMVEPSSQIRRAA